MYGKKRSTHCSESAKSSHSLIKNIVHHFETQLQHLAGRLLPHLWYTLQGLISNSTSFNNRSQIWSQILPVIQKICQTEKWLLQQEGLRSRWHHCSLFRFCLTSVSVSKLPNLSLLKQNVSNTSLSKSLSEKRFTSPSLWRRKKGTMTYGTAIHSFITPGHFISSIKYKTISRCFVRGYSTDRRRWCL